MIIVGVGVEISFHIYPKDGDDLRVSRYGSMIVDNTVSYQRTTFERMQRRR